MKTSLDIPNIANLIEARVAERFPELAAAPIDDCWFTGSRIWTAFYPKYKDCQLDGTDWDIFCLTEEAGAQVVARLGLTRFPACKTADKAHGVERIVSPDNVPELDGYDPDKDCASYNDGFSFVTDRGEIDVWISRPGTVVGELRTYPFSSHAHCRVAFSLVDGLVVLPNDYVKPAPADPSEDIEF